MFWRMNTAKLTTRWYGEWPPHAFPSSSARSSPLSRPCPEAHSCSTKQQRRRYFRLLRGPSSAPMYGAAVPWPSNPGAPSGDLVAQALLLVALADAFHASRTGKSAFATPHAAHDGPCPRIPKRSFPHAVPQRGAKPTCTVLTARITRHL